MISTPVSSPDSKTMLDLTEKSEKDRTPEPVFTDRPWLNMYNMRVRAVAPAGSTGSMKRKEDSALIHRMLPDQVLLDVFAKLNSVSLGRALCVCRKWRSLCLSTNLWKAACLRAWQNHSSVEVEKWAQSLKYGFSWRSMFFERPRVRTEGIYVSRNTYIRVGIVEWTVKNPVHMVCYFRYLRFLPSGKFYYKISPQFLKEVAKSMTAKPSVAKMDGVLVGKWTLDDDQVSAAIFYPGVTPTVCRIRGRLRGTCKAANNRIDILSIVTSGVEEEEVPDDHEDVLDITQSWGEAESLQPDLPAVSHKRGMSPFVFVPFENVDTDILNLPVDKMDFYRPG